MGLLFHKRGHEFHGLVIYAPIFLFDFVCLMLLPPFSLTVSLIFKDSGTKLGEKYIYSIKGILLSKLRFVR